MAILDGVTDSQKIDSYATDGLDAATLDFYFGLHEYEG